MLTLEQFRASRREIMAGSVDMPDHVNDMITGDTAVRSVYLYTDETWLAVRHDGRFHVFTQYDHFRESLAEAEEDVYGWHMTSNHDASEYMPMLEFMANDALPLCDGEWSSDRQITAENRFFEHAKAIFPAVLDDGFDEWCLKARTEEIVSEAMRRIKESL